MIKKFFIFIIFIILLNKSYANDLSSFNIDGLTLGDDLNFFFEDKDIKKLTKNYHSDKTFIPIEKKSSSDDFEVIQIYYKNNNSEKKIYAIAGINNLDVKKCLDEKKTYKDKFEFLFPNSNYKKNTIKNDYMAGKRVKFEERFINQNNNYAWVACYDWNTESKFKDQIRVGLTHNEFDKWIYSQ
jgi:hypothetical protein